MPTQTTNYKLNKPLRTEGVKIDVINGNYDTIDTAIENRSTIGTTLPTANMHKGDRFYKTDEKKEYYYDGSAWKQMESGKEYSDGDGVKIGTDLKLNADWTKVAHYPGKATATEEYNLPYHIETPIQETDRITAKFYTVALNETNTKKNFSIAIPAADVANNKAGLYTKELAENKVDIDQGASNKNKVFITDNNGKATLTRDLDVDGVVTKEFQVADEVSIDILADNANGIVFSATKPIYITSIDADNEIATKKDVKEGSNECIKLLGKVPGTSQEYNLPYFFDVVYGDKTATVTAHTVSLDNNKVQGLYPMEIQAMTDATAGLYNKELADKKISLLGNATPEGEPYHFPYNIRPLTISANQIVGKFDTITLDNTKSKMSFDVTLPAADVEGDKAGLYTKILADKKVDRTVKDDNNAINSIDNQKAQCGCVMSTSLGDANGTVVSFNTASENGADGILAQVYAKSTTGESAGKGMRLNFTKTGAYYGVGGSTPIDADHELAVKKDISTAVSDKMDKLPKETVSGMEYRFPFNINAIVQESDKISTSFDTLVLNDGVTRNNYPIVIPSADITNDKAGLYNKALADKKLDAKWTVGARDVHTPIGFVDEDGTIGPLDMVSVAQQTVTKQFLINDGNDLTIYGTGGGAVLSSSGKIYINSSVDDNEIATVGNVIQQLGNEAVSGKPYNLPYFFYTEAQPEKIVAHAKTISLDNKKTLGDYTLDVPAADIDNNKAGLYTISLAKLKVSVIDIVDNCTETSIDKPLSANQGRVLSDRIDNISAQGRYLSTWDCTTGLPGTDPAANPYLYKAGDYYVISKLATGTSKNYRPNGTQYERGVASTTEETATVSEISVNDTYKYDGTTWVLIHTVHPTTTFASIAGLPSDNTELAKEFNNQIHLLGKEPGSGQDYHFPFNINALVQEKDKISTTFDTITLDNNKTKVSYPISIPSADVDNNMAGLYTKELADLKQNKLIAVTNAEIDAMWS